MRKPHRWTKRGGGPETKLVKYDSFLELNPLEVEKIIMMRILH
jgi:hypothetical protein